jgi:NAD(P)-dependent dehydrogenase (short-subunit alcohol dehydrogenase family)
MSQNSLQPRLKGGIALVTGGLGGIGMAICRLFIEQGAELWLADIDPADSERVVKAMSQLGSAKYIRLDVTQRADWQRAAATIGERLDILVNNAGIAATGELEILKDEDWQRVMAVNSQGAFLSLAILSGQLANAGRNGERWASVVNISSILAMAGLPQASAYAASKGALRSFSKSAAMEFAQSGRPIRVNSLHPGFVETEMTRAGSDAMSEEGDLLETLGGETPMGRIGTPEEVAFAALFLASSESSYITGSELTVDGGWTAH